MNNQPPHPRLVFSAWRIARRGLTLVELLVVVVILGLIASMVLVGLSGTQNNAREAKTRGTIAKLHTLIMEKYDSYMSRRVPISIPANSSMQPKQAALVRLNGIRELMRFEMPDRHSDYLTDPQIINANPQIKLMAIPSVAMAYRRRATPASRSNSNFTKHESAECLYLIIANGLGESDGLSQFSESEIGDNDDDGMKEFLDAWGRPISFLRWAPRFDSAIQFPNRDVENSIDNEQFLDKHHDPFDVTQVDGIDLNGQRVKRRAYALYPVIFSAGADQSFDINEGTVRNPIFDPYFGTIGQADKSITSPFDPNGVEENWHDNITNHELLNP